jgi:hypothetical protein
MPGERICTTRRLKGFEYPKDEGIDSGICTDDSLIIGSVLYKVVQRKTEQFFSTTPEKDGQEGAQNCLSAVRKFCAGPSFQYRLLVKWTGEPTFSKLLMQYETSHAKHLSLGRSRV